MNIDVAYIIAIEAFLQSLIVVYIVTSLKKSIEHKFDKKLEEMRQAFAREMSDREREDKFRLAALDKRLDAHQKAYAFVGKLLNTLYLPEDNAERMATDKAFRVLLDDIALYLTNATRDAMMKAFGGWRTNPSVKLPLKVETDKSERKKLSDMQKEHWELLGNAFSVIVRSVDLEIFDRELTLHENREQEEDVAVEVIKA